MTTNTLTDYTTKEEKTSVKVLRECIELQLAKSKDYQNDSSSVVQADYYPRGVDSLYDMLNTKLLRIRSILDTARANPGTLPKFESLKDTTKDLINYASFFAAWLDQGVEGQEKLGHVDMFNRKMPMPTPYYSGALPGATVQQSPLGTISIPTVFLREQEKGNL